MNPAHEVVVVGGGVIGCAVAYELAKRSVQVLLLDKSLPGRATSASAGGIWPLGEAIGLGCGVIYHAVQSGGLSAEQMPQPEPLPAAFRDFLLASNARFPDLAVELEDLTGVDIEYCPGTGLLFVIYEELERRYIAQLAEAHRADARLEMLSAGEVAKLEPQLTRDLLGGVLLRGEHQVNPMLLAEALRRGAAARGASVQLNTAVTGLRMHSGRVVGVEADGAFFPAGTVVNAAGAWSGRLAATAGIELMIAPVRGQIVLTETLPPTLRGCLSTSACYLLQKAHGEILIGSTTENAGFDVSVTPEAITSLCQGAVRAVPMLRDVSIKRVWSGLRPGTPDELPILGPVAGVEGYVNATGGFRTGIVAAPLTGEVVAQLVCGEEACFGVESFLVERFETQTAAKVSDSRDGWQPERGITPACKRDPSDITCGGPYCD